MTERTKPTGVGAYSRIVELERQLSQALQRLQLICDGGSPEVCAELPDAYPQLERVVRQVGNAKLAARNALDRTAGAAS